MLKINRHIVEYLNYYCDKKNETPFAILLKGKWGSGKTHFVRNYIEGREDFLHISLYGLSKSSQIDEKIFEALHPFLSKSSVKLAGKAIAGIVKLSTTIDFNNDGKDDVILNSNGISKIDFNAFAKKSEDKIVIFDDIERCCIDIDKLFGYINHLAEFLGQKIIIVANEDKLIADKGKSKYLEIKEKLIGQEFVIVPNPEEAIKSFCSNIQDVNLKKFDKVIKDVLLKVFKQSDYENLRLTQQALSYFEYFYKKLSKKITINKKIIEKIFYEFCVIFTEYKKGEIKSDNFLKDFSYYLAEKDGQNRKHLFDKYDEPFPNWMACFDQKIIRKILNGYNLNNEENDLMVNRIREVIGVEKESWQIIWHYRNCDDDKFFECLEEVRSKWIDKEYDNFYVILHVFGIFLFFSEVGFIQRSKETVLSQGKEIINKLIADGKFPIDLNSKIFVERWDGASFGLGYHGKDMKEWEKMIKFIEEKIDDLQDKQIKFKIENELWPVLKGEKKLDQGLALFMNYNFMHIKGRREAYFNYFDVSEMTKLFLEDPEFSYLMEKIFIQRYTDPQIEINNIDKEKPFLKELKIMLENEIENIKKRSGKSVTPKTLSLKSFIKKAIDPFI